MAKTPCRAERFTDTTRSPGAPKGSCDGGPARAAAFRRTAAGLAVGAAGMLLVSCVQQSSTSSSATRPGAPGAASGYAAGSGMGAATEGYRSASPRSRGAGYLRLPGFQQRQHVTYELVDGMAVMEGDIMLGPASTLPLRYGLALNPLDPSTYHAVATTNTSHLWPGAVIPYEIDSSNSQSTQQSIQWAVAEVSKTRIDMRPRTAADQDYVVFRDTGTGCNSYVGRIGGAQVISTSGCSAGSLAHEILHAAGFYHEHSRSDRDNFVTIVWDEISPGQQDNFEKRTGISVDMGPYDYSSIMHYHGSAFSKSGRPTIIPKQAGANIGQRDGLSPLDAAAVNQLYSGSGTAPTTTPTQPTQPTSPGTPSNTSFSGNYVSQNGNVACSQNGAAVQCSFSGGTLWCTAASDDLSCGWAGSAGQGRAVFRRQPNGVLAGTWGDGFSPNSRGAWDLTPDTSAPAPTQPTQPAQPTPAFPIPWPTGSAAPALPPLPFPSGFPPWPQ